MKAEKAVFWLFKGETIKRVAKRFDCTEQTIRNRLKDFVSLAEETGILEAAETIGVKEEVTQLMKLNRNIHEKGLELGDCVTGSETSALIKEIGLEPPHLKTFIHDIYRYAQDNQLTGSKVGELLLRYNKLVEETGLDYTTSIQEWEKTERNKKTLIEDIKELEEKRKITNNELEKCLREADVTKAKLNSYVITKNILWENGLDIEDMEKAAKLIKELKEYDYIMDKIINVVDENTSIKEKNMMLKNEIHNLKNNKVKLEKEVNSLNNDKELLELRIDALKDSRKNLSEPLEKLFELHSLHIYNEDIIDLNKIIIDSGSSIRLLKNQINEIGSISKIMGNNNRKISDLENKIKILDNRKNILEEDIKFLESEKTELIKDSQNTLSNFHNNLDEIIDTFDKKINDPREGIKQKTLNLISTSFEETKKAIEEFNTEYSIQVDKLKKEGENTSKEIEEMKDTIYKMGTELGQYKTLNNLTKLIQGEKIPAYERQVTIISLLDNLSIIMLDGYPLEARKIREMKNEILREY